MTKEHTYSIAWMSAAAVLIAVFLAVSSCTRNMQEEYTKRAAACAAIGGQWIDVSGGQMCVRGNANG